MRFSYSRYHGRRGVKKYDLGMYDDKVAIQSETGEVIVVCDTIK